jgi:hypothetical protein
MKEKGASLEDSVAGYFRLRGFEVEPRAQMRDRSDVYHEIDVFASKKEDFGTIHVAVECKYVKTPTDIREVRNFHDKLDTLKINKGIFVSTGGFTADAEAYARTLGIELWDAATLRTKLAQHEIYLPETTREREHLHFPTASHEPTTFEEAEREQMERSYLHGAYILLALGLLALLLLYVYGRFFH